MCCCDAPFTVRHFLLECGDFAQVRKEEVVLARVRLGHTRVTHLLYFLTRFLY